MFCHKCGSQSLEGAEFCPKCGTKVDNYKLESTEPNSQNVASAAKESEQIKANVSAPSNAATGSEAFDLLKKNASLCPKIKDVSLNPKLGNVYIKGKLLNYSVNVKDGNIEWKFNRLSLPYIISIILFIGVYIVHEIAAAEFDWDFYVYWLVWGGYLVLDVVVMRLLAKPEREAVFSYINDTLKSQ